MWVWMHSWVCHGKIIGPAHGTCYQQAHYVLYISCLWCFALAVIPWLKVHLKLKGFNTHVRVYKVAACWKLRVCVRGREAQSKVHPKPPSERKPRISQPHYCGKSIVISRRYASQFSWFDSGPYLPSCSENSVARCLDHYWKVLEIERLSVFVIVQQRAPIRLFWCWCTFSLHASWHFIEDLLKEKHWPVVVCETAQFKIE